MLYEKLAKTYMELEKTSKRLEKTKILSEFLQEIDTEEIDVLYLLVGQIYPAWDERKIGISNQLIIKALEKAIGIDKEKIVQEWKSLGDIGKVAEELVKKKSQSTLSSSVLKNKKVINNLRKLPKLEGQGTIDKKISLITELLTSAKPLEAKYLVRTLLGDLRIGIQESTIRDALAKAFFDEKEKADAKKKIQQALDRSNDLAKTFKYSQEGKLKKLDEIKLEIGKPIKVMLAQKTNSIEESFESVGKPAAIEYKYDGFRLLISKDTEGNVKLFTRRLENVTKQFPEVEEYVKQNIKGESFILDSEAVGYDKKTKEYKPFQQVSQRIKRKYHIEELQKKLPIEINVFDILYYNGNSLLNKPFKERTELLEKITKNSPYKIIKSKQIITSNKEEAEKFYQSALSENQEGIMIKNLSSIYQPGSRVGHMLKLKPEGRDFDLVITGGEWGTGKRSGWLSSFIVSCIDEENNFKEVGKVGTGVKEKSGSGGITFSELTNQLKPLINKSSGRQAKIKPQLVVSVTYQEIQKSPTYSSGFALRFPRFTSLRPDRKPEDITKRKEIQEEYKKQS